MKNYLTKTWGFAPTEQQIGYAFEGLFTAYTIEQGTDLPPSNIRSNSQVIETDLIRNTEPDFLGDEIVFPPKSKPIPVDGAQIFELKAKGGGLYLSSQPGGDFSVGQMEGHINNQRNKFWWASEMYEESHFHPKVTLVTTSDVKFSPSISNHASNKKVVYQHIIAQFRVTNGKTEFRFSTIVGSNYVHLTDTFIKQ